MTPEDGPRPEVLVSRARVRAAARGTAAVTRRSRLTDRAKYRAALGEVGTSNARIDDDPTGGSLRRPPPPTLTAEPGRPNRRTYERGGRSVTSGNRTRTGLTAAAVAAAVLTAPILSAPAAHAGIVGGISVEQFCQGWYGPVWHAVVRYNNINGWRCTHGSTDKSVNYTTACAQQHGTPYWGYHDYYNPYTIFCYT